ncbi:hypothetical protein AAC387_Pa03g4167 [Persea americana]
MSMMPADIKGFNILAMAACSTSNTFFPLFHPRPSVWTEMTGNGISLVNPISVPPQNTRNRRSSVPLQATAVVLNSANLFRRVSHFSLPGSICHTNNTFSIPNSVPTIFSSPVVI